MTARGWSRLSLVPWVVYAVAFGVWAVIAFSHGLIAAGCVATVCVGIGAVMTVRAFRHHRRFVREHEADIAAIRAEAKRRIEQIEAWAEERRRRQAAVQRYIEGVKNAPHN